MIGRLPDILAAYPLRERLDREREDAEYLARRQDRMRVARDPSLNLAGMTWGGGVVFDTAGFKPYRPGEAYGPIVCARHDFDHPALYPDNRFSRCIDCGCELQHRPDIPAGVHICVCCAARRLRMPEAGG